MSLLSEAAIYLGAAVVAVPIMKRLGLGSVLGYLTAGAVIGPFGVKVVGHVDEVMHFSELGVVLMLFVIGLELEPARLWQLRRLVFGGGAAQMLVTGALVCGVGLALGLPPPAAIIAGLGLALSSTAIAMQLIGEKGEIATAHGRAGFGVLLFQDLAVIPLLALIPLLSGGGGPGLGLADVGKVIGVLVGVVVAGRFLVRPALRIVAGTHSHEVFTAAALLVVIGTALVVSLVGMSMALGAFLAGVLLADSEYRHEIEADIEPFKGLLLGLFFIAVGMSANLGLLVDKPLVVLGIVVGLLVVKALVLFALMRGIGIAKPGARTMAVALSQGGEFGFVLFGMATGAGVMSRELSDLLVVVVSVSMASTPVLMVLLDRVIEPRLREKNERDFDKIDDVANPVIIAGFGRYGQIIARVLNMAKIGYTALDFSTEQLDMLKRFGNVVYNKLYYGDASRLDLLRAAKADQAKAFVLAIDDPEASVRTAHMVRRNFPDLPIFARARNRQHAYKLLDLGVKVVNRETFLSSLEMAHHVLRAIGVEEAKAATAVERFRKFDEDLLAKQASIYKDDAMLVQTAQQAWAELRTILAADEEEEREDERPAGAAAAPTDPQAPAAKGASEAPPVG